MKEMGRSPQKENQEECTISLEELFLLPKGKKPKRIKFCRREWDYDIETDKYIQTHCDIYIWMQEKCLKCPNSTDVKILKR